MRLWTVALLAVVACRDSTSPPSVAGSYALATVDGQPLPAAVSASIGGAAPWFYLSWALTLGDDGSCASDAIISPALVSGAPGQRVVREPCSYRVLNGSRVSLTTTTTIAGLGATSFTRDVRIADGRLVDRWDGRELVFVRRGS